MGEVTLSGEGPVWNADRVIAGLPMERWRGLVWRMHGIRYDAASVRGAELSSGRYHRARAQAQDGRVWRVLYTPLDSGTSIGEAIRNVGVAGTVALRGRRLSELRVELGQVIDLRDPTRLNLTLDELTSDRDYSVAHAPTITQELARASLDRGVEGILVPSATHIGTNLIILTDNLLSSSSIEVVRFIDPRLHVDRG